LLACRKHPFRGRTEGLNGRLIRTRLDTFWIELMFWTWLLIQLFYFRYIRKNWNDWVFRKKIILTGIFLVSTFVLFSAFFIGAIIVDMRIIPDFLKATAPSCDLFSHKSYIFNEGTIKIADVTCPMGRLEGEFYFSAIVSRTTDKELSWSLEWMEIEGLDFLFYDCTKMNCLEWVYTIDTEERFYLEGVTLSSNSEYNLTQSGFLVKLNS